MYICSYTKQQPRSIHFKPSDKTTNDNESESKITPQLQRKRYLEEKARDLREVHDDLKLASDSLTRPRTPTLVIRWGGY